MDDFTFLHASYFSRYSTFFFFFSFSFYLVTSLVICISHHLYSALCGATHGPYALLSFEPVLLDFGSLFSKLFFCDILSKSSNITCRPLVTQSSFLIPKFPWSPDLSPAWATPLESPKVIVNTIWLSSHSF